MKICPSCKTANSEFKQYCVHCGAPLPKVTTSGGYAFGLKKNEEEQDDILSHRLSFTEAISVCLRDKYATFSGRARRSEYWYFWLFTLIVSLIVCGVCAVLGYLFLFNEPDAVKVFTYIGALAVSLLLLSPGLAVLIRRLHDTDKSGWYTLLLLVPLANIVVVIFTLLPSDPKTNKYGPRP